MDLETLATEYEAIAAELVIKRKLLKQHEQALSEAGSALIQAMIEQGLTEYGPMTSELRQYGESIRRHWRPVE